MIKIQALPGGRYNSEQAAKYLGKSRSWLEKERSKGRGPSFRRVGATVEYSQTALDAYLNGCEVETEDSRKADAA